MYEYAVEGHAASLLPGDDWELVWADEFDGNALDRSKWDYRLCMMGKRWPAWTDKGVHLDGRSNAVFTILEEEGRIVSSQLQTGYNFMDRPVERTTFGTDDLQWGIGKLKKSMFTHGPGYYECRCRLQQREGWWSAFWLQSPIIGASLDPAESGVEIDVMESFHPGQIDGHNVFTGGYGQDSKRVQTGGTTVDVQQYHRFGLLWEETGYTFFVDGVEDGRIQTFQTARPEFILISTEVAGYRKAAANKTFLPASVEAAKAGDTFLVDYVRVFERKGDIK